MKQCSTENKTFDRLSVSVNDWMTDGYYGVVAACKLYVTLTGRKKKTPLCSANSRMRRKCLVIQPMGLLDKHASRLPLFKHLNIGVEVANTGSASTAGYGIQKVNH